LIVSHYQANMELHRNAVENRATEPVRFRTMSKKQLYAEASAIGCVPGITSRGVTRAYLIGVIERRFFVMPQVELNGILAPLTPNQLKRSPHYSGATAIVKLNAILHESGRNPTGFDAHSYPEEDWVSKYLRAVDLFNVSEAFLESVQPIVRPVLRSQRMKAAKTRIQAELYTIGGVNILDNRKVWDSLQNVWNIKKKYDQVQCEIACTQRQLEIFLAKRPVIELELETANAACGNVVKKARNAEIRRVHHGQPNPPGVLNGNQVIER